MAREPHSFQSRRRTGRRYAVWLFIVLALIGGWTWLWRYASDKATETIEGWRAREAKAGHIYSCGKQTIGGYPFRIEINCDQAGAVLRDNQPPFELKVANVLVAAEVFQPTLLTSEYASPLTVAAPGQPPAFIASWKSAQSRARGTPASPESISVVLDGPSLDRMNGSSRESVIKAQHIEILGHMLEGSASKDPVIEVTLRTTQMAAPGLNPFAATPIDGDIDVVLRGMKDFAPKSWPARFHEIQAANGRIDINKARVQQGETVAVGSGTVSINPQGNLQGQLTVTITGLEPFLKSIGADRFVQNSPTVDRLAGTLDRLMPGLGNVARQQAGANLGAGINLLGEQTVLEGKRAVKLPLRIDDGTMFLGPIPVGKAPALF